MSIHDSLHNISEQSDAANANLWYQIEAQLEEKDKMKKAKRKPVRFQFNRVAVLLGFVIVSTFAIWQINRPIYDYVTLDDIAEMATPIDESMTRNDITVTVDWAYADPTQIVVAYHFSDRDGNDLEFSFASNVQSELIILSGENRYTGSTYEAIPYESQFVMRASTPYSYFNQIDSYTDSGNLNERTTLDLRLVFTVDIDEDIFTTYLVDFAVPYGVINYVESDGYDYATLNSDIAIPSTYVAEGDIFVNQLVISDSAISAVICIALPSNSLGDSYSLNANQDIDLYVNNHRIENIVYNLETSNDTMYPIGIFEQQYFYININDDGMRQHCGHYLWHIRFRKLPKTLRIAMPSLTITTLPPEFETQAQRQTYIDIYEAFGYDLIEDDRNSLSISSIRYPDEWYDNDPYAQYTIQQRVIERYFEAYPLETSYPLNWEYTYNLRD